MGAIVHPYQSPAIVNAGLPELNLAAGKAGGTDGWPFCCGTWRYMAADGPEPGATGEAGSLPPKATPRREGAQWDSWRYDTAQRTPLLEPPPLPSPKSQKA
ncbi:hypothetical protein BDS110ZK25_64010 [Bradyrhizobium diazoefficiens]|uniref:Uncharacterized protein n=1 Tax=Bradyrhizobium diazoefficiens TaxID=1355477 RepID=A0A809Y4Q7_9BRAD|nr:hypothetical protein H12S4_79020 [Bradyrhizobium diazoefficiens]BCA24349.1 hypothetical protein BDHH15_75640 [Bradyrhizobium diazoefficiens]BCE25059.1 hypothetical protein XF1B_77400 [Bradyrhizobium diazoefficiens]BCE33825.1 hypothetical protein XF2B_75940 [Bradyrhizobium diazoefficiens]BCE42505.1 hypothetical protein XF3B_75360 [Bradyrhizobium diazoefficiens]